MAYNETKTLEDFRAVQQLQLRYRTELVWSCDMYYNATWFAPIHHDLRLAKPDDLIYQELRVDPEKVELQVCANCGGVRRLHKYFSKFIDRRTP